MYSATLNSEELGLSFIRGQKYLIWVSNCEGGLYSATLNSEELLKFIFSLGTLL